MHGQNKVYKSTSDNKDWYNFIHADKPLWNLRSFYNCTSVYPSAHYFSFLHTMYSFSAIHVKMRAGYVLWKGGEWQVGMLRQHDSKWSGWNKRTQYNEDEKDGSRVQRNVYCKRRGSMNKTGIEGYSKKREISGDCVSDKSWPIECAVRTWAQCKRQEAK